MSFGPIDAGRGRIRLEAESDLRPGLQAAEREVQSFAQRLRQRGRLLTIIGGGAAGAGFGVLRGLRAAANEAGDFSETLNRSRAVFGDLSDDAVEFSRDFARATNRARDEILNGLTSFQSFFVGLDIPREAAADLSKEVVKLATDFSSLNNIDQGEAIGRFISALSGSSEVVDRFGINLKAAALDQEFLRLGLDRTTRTASEQEKTIARLAIINRTLGQQGAVGDAVRTANEYVNSQRGVTAAFRDLRRAVGGPLLESLASYNVSIISVIRSATEFVQANPELVQSISAVATAAAAGGGLIASAGVLMIGASVAFNSLGQSAATSVAPVVAVGQAGGAVGSIFGSLGGILAAPFRLLGQSAALSARALGPIAIGVSGLVQAFGGLPVTIVASVAALSLAVAGLGVTRQSLTRTVNSLRDILQLLGAIARIGFVVLDTIERWTRPISRAANQLRGVAADLIRIARGADPSIVFENLKCRRDGRPILGADGSEQSDNPLSFSADELAEQFGKSLELAKEAIDEAAPGVRDELSKLFANLRDKIGMGLSGQGFDFSGLDEQFAAFEEQAGKFLPSGTLDTLRTQFEQLKSLGDRLKNEVGKIDFSLQNEELDRIRKELLDNNAALNDNTLKQLLQNLQGAADTTQRMRTPQQQTAGFFGTNTRLNQLFAPNTDVMDQIRDVNEEQLVEAKKHTDLLGKMQNRGGLAWGA